MNIDDIQRTEPDALAPVLLAALQRLGQLGRDGAVALGRLVKDDDADFDEAAGWIESIADGELSD
ncbi:MAG: hypothetical protein CVT77_17125 [Alphaproteobacteria bacterium HGW-Alphaproteobacteria-16]|nr:MAG: hypothetical protein CVT77_17125 [Alphaproteobacteria bacterium HGW-Alphaproteobacteria-16]